MEHFHHLTDTTSRVSRNIAIRADRLARSGAVPGMDAEDIEQELRLDLIRRAPKFDPDKASFETFADRVVANAIANLAAATHASRAARQMYSLDAPADGHGDNDISLADVLCQASGIYSGDDFSRINGPGLRSDIGKLLAALCPATRHVAIALSQLSVSETARTLGLHRCTIYERLAVIRKTATSLGLQGYFETNPTVSSARR